MAITQAICNSFKKQLLEADMNFKLDHTVKFVQTASHFQKMTSKKSTFFGHFVLVWQYKLSKLWRFSELFAEFQPNLFFDKKKPRFGHASAPLIPMRGIQEYFEKLNKVYLGILGWKFFRGTFSGKQIIFWMNYISDSNIFSGKFLAQIWGKKVRKNDGLVFWQYRFGDFFGMIFWKNFGTVE